MKTAIIAILCLLAGAAAGGLVTFLALRAHVRAGSDEVEFRWQHHASEREARMFFRLAQAFDEAGCPQNEKVRRLGRRVLQAYVAEAQNIQKRGGSQWCPTDAKTYEKARKYLEAGNP